MAKKIGLWRYVVMNVKNKIILVTIFLFTIISISNVEAKSSICVKSSDAKICTSPNGRFSIIFGENLNHSTTQKYVLILKDNMTNIRRILYYYDRWISAIWSPDSQKILINNYAGSDYTLNIILYINRKIPPINLQNELIRYMTAKEQQIVKNNDHIYFSALEWIDNKNIKLIVWGHGAQNPDGFCKCYIYKMSVGIRQCEESFKKDNVDLESYCEQLKK
jgi:hypothetical protein